MLQQNPFSSFGIAIAQITTARAHIALSGDDQERFHLMSNKEKRHLDLVYDIGAIALVNCRECAIQWRRYLVAQQDYQGDPCQKMLLPEIKKLSYDHLKAYIKDDHMHSALLDEPSATFRERALTLHAFLQKFPIKRSNECLEHTRAHKEQKRLLAARRQGIALCTV